MIGLKGAVTSTLAILLAGAAPAVGSSELSYQITEGRNINAFLRAGETAAHVLLRNGKDPRILIAFPAGNSGVGLWFDDLDHAATWHIDQAIRPVRSGKLNGVVVNASIDASRLTPKQAVLSSVRFLRDYQASGKYPAEVKVDVATEGDTLVYKRARLDGAPGYELRVRVKDGSVVAGQIRSRAGNRISLEITALTGDQPLTPIPAADLLNANAAPDTGARDALTFLSYREKLLAGSWRFNTYFGRDTLMSVRLLMPALKPLPIEAGLNSVLARLAPNGEVAHEEGIGEFAVKANRAAGKPGDRAELDYSMVDDDYMLAPVAAEYLLGSGKTRAAAYLAQPLASVSQPEKQEATGAAIVRNLRFVLSQAKAFAQGPSLSNLIAIKPGHMAGEWRDSNDGLGRGVYAYDVNAVLVPAALEAGARLYRAGLLNNYVSKEDRAALDSAVEVAAKWRSAAPPMFEVHVPSAIAQQRITSYAKEMGVPAQPALSSLGNRAVTFHAISLDANGKPVRVINSDEGFELLFGMPSPAFLDTYVTSMMRPFPAGLMTDVGLLVANPVFSDRAVQALFTPGAYHGTVIWSWQQALLAAGLERQLARSDLPPALRNKLSGAQRELWKAIRASKAVQSSELWSWTFQNGRYTVVPFGAGKADVDESNAAQLWSTVYLAVQEPRRR